MSCNPWFERLSCPACDERFWFPSHYFSYTDRSEPEVPGPDGIYVDPMLTKPIWCHACNQPSYEERIPSMSEFSNAIAVLRRPDDLQMLGIRDDLLSLGFDKGIEAVQHLGQQLVNRTEPHRCLMCGNESVTPIKMAEDRATPLRHEACGGSLYLEQVAMHHCVREPIRYFNWRGEFLWEQPMPRISPRLPK